MSLPSRTAQILKYCNGVFRDGGAVSCAVLVVPCIGAVVFTSWCVIVGGHPGVVRGMVDRAVLTHPLFTGVSVAHLASLVEELARSWSAAVEGRRFRERGGARQRALGTGARYRLVFVDRLVATLIHLRHDLPHAVLAVLFDVDRSTVTRVVGEVRELLAERGCAVVGIAR